MVKIVVTAVMVLLAVALGFQIGISLDRLSASREDLRELQGRVQGAVLDQRKLQDEIRYYGNLVNFEKEIRQRFNLRTSDEKLIIIVPPATTSRATSTTP